MSDNLNQEIAYFQEQVTDITSQLDEASAADQPDFTHINALKVLLNTTQSRLDDKLKEQAEKEKAIATAQEDFSSALDNLSLFGETVSLRAFIEGEKNYQTCKIALAGYITSLAIKHNNTLQVLKQSYEGQLADKDEEITRFKQEIDEIRGELVNFESLQKDYHDLKTSNATLQEACNDAFAKRDAAARELAEAQEEIKKLRNQLATPMGVTTPALSYEEQKKQIEDWKNNRPAIYNVQSQDLKNSVYTATLASTGEEITFKWTEKGKYREVTAEEAEVFRQQHEQEQTAATEEQAEPVAENPTPSVDIVAPPALQFQEETVPNGQPGVSQEEQGVGVHGTEQTVEERLTALEARVTALESGKTVAA